MWTNQDKTIPCSRCERDELHWRSSHLSASLTVIRLQRSFQTLNLQSTKSIVSKAYCAYNEQNAVKMSPFKQIIFPRFVREYKLALIITTIGLRKDYCRSIHANESSRRRVCHLVALPRWLQGSRRQSGSRYSSHWNRRESRRQESRQRKQQGGEGERGTVQSSTFEMLRGPRWQSLSGAWVPFGHQPYYGCDFFRYLFYF